MSDERRELWWESPTVELGRVLHLQLDEPFRAEHGGVLERIQISYESWGHLDAHRDDAVLIVHPMTADCHATGAFRGEPQGWWEDLIGPGRAIDTDRTFVVCPDLLGGCYGATGPRFPAPDGRPYFDRFPLLTPRDIMRVQRLFVQQLGIRRLRTVIGPSMGGMIAWEWAIEASDLVDRAVVVAAPLVTTAHQIGMNWLQRRGIELDITEDNEVAQKFGQMIARGVGMLSYRSPLGLEEKFGREWFKQPGATLGERGIYNIESWLRHHGKRITKRFDPYTYLLFSRAMDLHDVSAGRGDLVAALQQVDCEVVVAGISTDNLYPPQDVHTGADMLSHLGKDVRYAEIRSLHGHDAFLLETDQLDAILRESTMPAGAVPALPVRSDRELRVVRLGILGAGRVAKSFARLVAQRRDDFVARRGIRFDLTAVAEIDPLRPIDPAFAGAEILRDPAALVAREDVDVVIDLTRGTDSSPLVRAALERRRPVVTPNKRLVRNHGAELERVAFQHGVRLAWHDSIAAGWPLMYALERPMVRGDITGVRAILSSTGNVILDRMAAGTGFEEALQEAILLEITEVDPDLDLSGWDAAQKLSIVLSRLTRRRQPVDGIDVARLDSVDPVLVRTARQLALCIKPVAWARINGDDVEATVRPMAVPLDSHLGANRGSNHVVVLQSSTEGEIVQIGEGAGTLPVATAVWNDLLGVLDPARSWTGRFPPAERAPRAPEFDTHVVAAGGAARLVDAPVPGSVPVLPH
ncbi:MAG: homoserine O-acetyltransferase [Planctomycetes bacterium]|nr:homoserine O-acetyltransferase [Planctomycetota bacterium]